MPEPSVLATATIPDAITFAVAAVICVGGSLGLVLSRNPVHSALNLVLTLFGVAVLFVELDAQFLAVVQVIVYAGAIVVLFLFVIMLLGVDREEALRADPLKGQRFLAVLLGILVLVEVIILARGNWPVGPKTSSGHPLHNGTTPNITVLGRAVFSTYLLAFEITSALLVIAVIGAVVLARRPRGGGDVGPRVVESDVNRGDDQAEAAIEEAAGRSSARVGAGLPADDSTPIDDDGSTGS